jgi:membrane protease YdiL (CAAX protease family)
VAFYFLNLVLGVYCGANLQLIGQAMQYRSVKGISGWGQLGILVAFSGLGFLLAAVVQLFIGMQLVPSGLPADKMAEAIMKAMMLPENVGHARLAQVLGTFFLLFVPATLYFIICHGRNRFWFGFNKHINGWQILIGFFIIFLANIIAAPLADISKNLLSHMPGLNAMAQKMEAAYSDQVTALSNLKSWPEFLMALVIMAFFPALFEEVFFRGALQNLLVRWWKAPLLGIIVTSILFSIIHMSLYLFLSRAVLGFVLGLMYQRSKNLWVNIIAHFLNNAIALAQLFWWSRHNTKVDLDKLDPKVSVWLGLVAVAICYALFLLFEKRSAKNRQLVELKEAALLEKNSLFHAFPET